MAVAAWAPGEGHRSSSESALSFLGTVRSAPSHLILCGAVGLIYPEAGSGHDKRR
jgi:hypothetical protein